MRVKMTPAREGLTLAERAEIIKEALRLLKSPMNWTTGDWKCQLFKHVDTDEVKSESELGYWQKGSSMWEPLTDSDGKRQYAYCVEGAVNQATLNVLGAERAKKIGGLTPNSLSSGIMTELVSVNEYLRSRAVDDKYGWKVVVFEGEETDMLDRPAQGVNDAFHKKEKGHAAVVKLLRARLRQLRDQIRKEAKS